MDAADIEDPPGPSIPWFETDYGYHSACGVGDSISAGGCMTDLSYQTTDAPPSRTTSGAAR